MPRVPAILAAVVFAALAAASARVPLEPEALQAGKIREPDWLPDGRAVRLVAMGQHQLLAEAYWLKTVQYMGETALAGGDWRALHPLADITTDLDPRFGYAYQIAGSNLAGLAHRYEEADRILQKGMRNVPDRWSLAWTHAINKFLYERDFAAAAEYARRAAEIGKRPHLALLAANLSLVTDDVSEYAAAEAILADAIAQTDTDELRDQLEQRLVKVRTYEVLSRVEQAVAEFENRFGRRPILVGELVAQGLLARIPPDPSGGAIIYDLGKREVRSTVLGSRVPLRID
jgi:tetratricopeptide (TPR) repeat protein